MCLQDLATATAFKHWCHFIDIFGVEAKAANPSKYQLLVDKLSFYVDSYESDFEQEYVRIMLLL